MAKIQFLTILLTVTCLLGGVVSVTDKEFEDLVTFVHQQAAILEEKSTIIEEQSVTIKHLSTIAESQSTLIQEMRKEQGREIQRLNEEIERQNMMVNGLRYSMVTDLRQEMNNLERGEELLQNATIEERVTILENQVAEIEEDVTGLDQDVNFLFDEQVIQDERLLILEQDSDVFDDEIERLQMTDVELDERVTALEGQNDTFAFHIVLTSYTTIADESAVLFNEVLLNEGGGYDSTTGTFTVQSGGDGFYYFSTYLVVTDYEYGTFDIQINGETLCTAYTEEEDTSAADRGQAACSGAAYVTESDEVQVVYRQGTDTTPLYLISPYFLHGFTGFRI